MGIKSTFILKFYLYFVTICLLNGCVSSGLKKFNPSKEAKFPPDHLFSINSKEQNSSDNLFFQTLGLSPEIINLVDKALKENPGWLAQLAKVDEVKESVGLLTDDIKPKFNSSLGWLPGRESTRESDFKTSKTPELKSKAVLGWEIDLWGKWSARKKEADHAIINETHIRDGAKLTLIYEIAKLWYQYEFQTEDLSCVENLIKNHHEAHILHLHKYHAGLDGNESLIVMENEIKQLVLEYNRVKSKKAVYKTGLQTILGGTLDYNFSNVRIFSNEPIPDLPKKLPSIALRGRPDILASYARLMAQSQRAKASILNLYPSLNLNFTGIGMTGDLSKPFDQWRLNGGPIIDIPLWSPKRKTQLAIDQQKLKILELEWKKTILNAVRDIESALINHQSLIENLAISENLKEEQFKVYKLTEHKYHAGLISKIDLLKKYNEYEQARRNAISIKLSSFLSFIQLAKSLGINWAKIS